MGVSKMRVTITGNYRNQLAVPDKDYGRVVA